MPSLADVTHGRGILFGGDYNPEQWTTTLATEPWEPGTVLEISVRSPGDVHGSRRGPDQLVLAVGDPGAGGPGGGDPAGGDPAGGDPAGGDPAGGDPAGGQPSELPGRRELARLDGRYLSTEVAGGFTGRMVGVSCTSGELEVHRFRYEGDDSGA